MKTFKSFSEEKEAHEYKSSEKLLKDNGWKKSTKHPRAQEYNHPEHGTMHVFKSHNMWYHNYKQVDPSNPFSSVKHDGFGRGIRQLHSYVTNLKK